MECLLYFVVFALNNSIEKFVQCTPCSTGNYKMISCLLIYKSKIYRLPTYLGTTYTNSSTPVAIAVNLFQISKKSKCLQTRL